MSEGFPLIPDMKYPTYLSLSPTPKPCINFRGSRVVVVSKKNICSISTGILGQ